MEPTVPSKKLHDASDLVRFRRSIAYKNIHVILEQVINKVKGCDLPVGVLDPELVNSNSKKMSPFKRQVPKLSSSNPLPLLESETKTILPTQPVPDVLTSAGAHSGILNILKTLDKFIDEIPPQEGPRRFGNLAVREWHERVNAELPSLIKDNIKYPTAFASTVELETTHYLLASFGLPVRLDFGTGHELSFLAFLGGVPNLINDATGEQLLAIFAKYFDLVRRLILVYTLEPAGSHGVWGLDDHFHLIFILGAAQFNYHQDIQSQSSRASTMPSPLASARQSGRKQGPPISLILSNQAINTFKNTNLYVNGIAFIFKIKLGPFNEHSPMLYDIHASVTLWEKVLSGLVKMYEVEVFGKFPVVQHFWFGNVLYPWRDVDTNKELPIYIKAEEEADRTGLVDVAQGTRLPRTSVPMTGAPWARR